MAALATQNLGNGGAYTLAAATAGGDTIVGGPSSGGWGDASLLVVSVGATATTVTVDGTAYGPYTSQTAIVPVRRYNGAPVNITYSQAASVTVGSVRLGSALAPVFGT